MKKSIAPCPYETPSIRPIKLAENDVITTSNIDLGTGGDTSDRENGGSIVLPGMPR